MTKTLITPVHCKSLWRQFKTETEYTVTQAIAAQVCMQFIFSFPCFKILNITDPVLTLQIYAYL